eukprot:TRINITY_DN3230_c0_g2_i3.p1 TRINITY_DN3230_c0_g2~~TRINITY_DN3230_c0_g2_i3.p1  ORF type:complete len:1167 (+),score=357.14 TRINITY_DN3230_c0_g2_i3:118-3618(+)
MEFLSEMEGDDERLQKLTEAQLKPEDQMQTDEWMYELREQELQRRRRFSAGAEAEDSPDDPENCIRLTSDREEQQQLERKSSAFGAANIRRSSLADAVRAEAGLGPPRTSVSDVSTVKAPTLPPYPPFPPPVRAFDSANTGREPPEPEVLEAGGTPQVRDMSHAPAPANTWATPVQTPREDHKGAALQQEDSPDVVSPPVPQLGPITSVSSPAMMAALGAQAKYVLDEHADHHAKKVHQGMVRRRRALRVTGHSMLAVVGGLAVATSALLGVDAAIDGARWVVFVVPVLCAAQLLLLAASVHSRNRSMELVAQDTTLLHSLLPSDVVAQMHQGVRCIAVHHDSLTFCFCDLVGFTKATGRLPPDKLVLGLNKLITLFDAYAKKMSITKIKTMGDAYMAVSGFRQPPHCDHIHQMILWCIKMIRTLRHLRVAELDAKGVFCRMGVASGPAVSGTIGVVKPVYDFWGDTVNMASRMESNSAKMRINCTKEVRVHLMMRHGYHFDVQNDIFIKGKGRMDTYLLIDPRDRQRELDEQEASYRGIPRKQEEEKKKLTGVEQFASEIEQLASIQSEKGFHNDIRQVLQAVSALTEELELQKATELVVKTVRELLRCDRATLFMVDEEHKQLWSFHNLDKQGRRIRMPMDKGLAGWAATHAEVVNISDAYDDPRFNKQVDVITGYRTRNLLCYPVVRGDHVIAIIQAVNKFHGKFNEEDTLMIALLGRQAGIHLMHGQMYEQLRQSEMRAFILFQVSRDLNTTLRPSDIFENVTMGAQRFMQCQRATLFIVDHQRRELYSIDTSSTGEFQTIVMPLGTGIAGHVAVVGEVTNIPDVYKVPLFDQSHDQRTGFRTKSVLCVPIVDTAHKSAFPTGFVLGVLEAINKYHQEDITQQNLGTAEPVPFSKDDEQYLQSFASFVAVTIRNAMLHEQNNVQQEHGRLLVRLSVVSAAARGYDELVQLLQREIPAALNCEACQLFVQVSRRVLDVFTAEGRRELRLGQGEVTDCGLVGEVVLGKLSSYRTSTGSTQCENHNMFADPRFNAAIDNAPRLPKIEQCLILPLTYDDHIVGALQVFNKRPSEAQTIMRGASARQGCVYFDRRDETFLMEIARVVAVHLCCQHRVRGTTAGSATPLLPALQADDVRRQLARPAEETTMQGLILDPVSTRAAAIEA